MFSPLVAGWLSAIIGAPRGRCRPSAVQTFCSPLLTANSAHLFDSNHHLFRRAVPLLSSFQRSVSVLSHLTRWCGSKESIAPVDVTASTKPPPRKQSDVNRKPNTFPHTLPFSIPRAADPTRPLLWL